MGRAGKQPAATGDLNIQGSILGSPAETIPGASRAPPALLGCTWRLYGRDLAARDPSALTAAHSIPAWIPASLQLSCRSCWRSSPSTLGTAWCCFPFHFQAADGSPLSLDGFFALGFSLRSREMESFCAQPGTRSCSEVTNTAVAANIVTAALGYSLTPLPTHIPTHVTTAGAPAGDTARSCLTCQPAPVTQSCDSTKSGAVPRCPHLPLQHHRCCFPSGCVSALPWPQTLHPSPFLTSTPIPVQAANCSSRLCPDSRRARLLPGSMGWPWGHAHIPRLCSVPEQGTACL